MVAPFSLGSLLEKFGALGVREKGVVALGLAIGIFLLTDRLWLSNSSARIDSAIQVKSAVEARVAPIAARVQALRATRGLDSLIATRERELGEIQAQVEAITAIRRGATEQPLSVTRLIRTALRTPNPRVVVDAIKAIPSQRAVELPSAGPGQPPITLYRHGIDAQVRGGYADLVAYLQMLEREPRIFWSGTQLSTRNYPELNLRITIHTLSTEEKAALQ